MEHNEYTHTHTYNHSLIIHLTVQTRHKLKTFTTFCFCIFIAVHAIIHSFLLDFIPIGVWDSLLQGYTLSIFSFFFLNFLILKHHLFYYYLYH